MTLKLASWNRPMQKLPTVPPASENDGQQQFEGPCRGGNGFLTDCGIGLVPIFHAGADGLSRIDAGSLGTLIAEIALALLGIQTQIPQRKF